MKNNNGKETGNRTKMKIEKKKRWGGGNWKAKRANDGNDGNDGNEMMDGNDRSSFSFFLGFCFFSVLPHTISFPPPDRATNISKWFIFVKRGTGHGGWRSNEWMNFTRITLLFFFVWMNDWMSEWVNEWMNECTNERMDQLHQATCRKWQERKSRPRKSESESWSRTVHRYSNRLSIYPRGPKFLSRTRAYTALYPYPLIPIPHPPSPPPYSPSPLSSLLSKIPPINRQRHARHPRRVVAG